MTGIILAVMVGTLFGTGVYLILRRDSIRLLLGLGLLSYGINMLLFGAGTLQRGSPPIVEDKAAFSGDISTFVDPMPQALILTAIVISFSVTAFVVVLVNRRYSLSESERRQGRVMDAIDEPFASGHYASDSDTDSDVNADDYECIIYSPSGEFRLREDNLPPTPEVQERA
jgi:multicomponent Na+:H+ antiporter subunit C